MHGTPSDTCPLLSTCVRAPATNIYRSPVSNSALISPRRTVFQADRCRPGRALWVSCGRVEYEIRFTYQDPNCISSSFSSVCRAVSFSKLHAIALLASPMVHGGNIHVVFVIKKGGEGVLQLGD